MLFPSVLGNMLNNTKDIRLYFEEHRSYNLFSTRKEVSFGKQNFVHPCSYNRLYTHAVVIIKFKNIKNDIPKSIRHKKRYSQ